MPRYNKREEKCLTVKCKTVIPKRVLSLFVTGLVSVILAMVFTVPVFADTSNDGVDTGDPETIAKKKYTAATEQSADSWEITLWIDGAQKGDLIIYGPLSVRNTNGDPSLLQRLQWGPSKGVKNSTTKTGGTVAKQKTPKSVPWNNVGIRQTYMDDLTRLQNDMLNPMASAGQISMAEVQKILNQEKLIKAGTLTQEEIDAKVASGEFCHWLISMEPVHIIYWSNGTVITGSVAAFGFRYDMDKRQEMYNNWKSGSFGNWIPFTRAQSRANPERDEDAGFQMAPPDWKTPESKKWSVLNNAQYMRWFFKQGDTKVEEFPVPSDNYVLIYSKMKSVPPKEPPIKIPDDPTGSSTTPPPQGGFPPLHIFEYEMLAAIPTDWSKNSLGNTFGSDHEEHFIKEKTNAVPGYRVHTIEDTSNKCMLLLCKDPHTSHTDAQGCYEWVPPVEPNEDGTGGKEGYDKLICTEPLHVHTEAQGCFCVVLKDVVTERCDARVTYEWKTEPVLGAFNETDLRSESNVGKDTDHGAVYSQDYVNRYQMTRLGGMMDLEFISKGVVFKVYQWNNMVDSPGPKIYGPTQSGSYKSVTAKATEIAGPNKPFEAGFSVSFNSHRFAKWADPEPLHKAGGERGFIPLAGYMLDVSDQKQYIRFMEDRDLLIRTKWLLDEKEQSFIAAMYNGQPGTNIKWGHGGDDGTSSGDSDMDYENWWKWVAEDIITPDHTEFCPTHNNIPKDCACSRGASNGTDADFVQTPRAAVGRTLIVDNTMHGEKKEHLQDGMTYTIRRNEEGNDRFTLTVPSTKFVFSPTYRMYADYALDRNRAMENETPVWCLASDTDTAQFKDYVDLNLRGGETVVKAPWSRDYEDNGATDPNGKLKIPVTKSGNAYSVLTENSRLEITAVIHYWDEKFYQDHKKDPNNAQLDFSGNQIPNGGDSERPLKYNDVLLENTILKKYADSINRFLHSFADENFAFYTNLVGGTSVVSPFREYPSMNKEIFSGAPFSARQGELKLPDPFMSYPKLPLSVNISKGYVTNGKIVHEMDEKQGDLDNRINGALEVWDTPKSEGSTEWRASVFNSHVPDLVYDDDVVIKNVLVEDSWYVEDFEGLKVAVLKASVEFPAIRSNPATIYEKLSDFKTDLNAWSPQLTHPIARVDSDGENEVGIFGQGNSILIPKGSVGAGTNLITPPLEVYPGGVKGTTETLSDWPLCFKPYRFGVRGSAFDNAQ